VPLTLHFADTKQNSDCALPHQSLRSPPKAPVRTGKRLKQPARPFSPAASRWDGYRWHVYFGSSLLFEGRSLSRHFQGFRSARLRRGHKTYTTKLTCSSAGNFGNRLLIQVHLALFRDLDSGSAVHEYYLHFFGGFLMVSTIVVLGRRIASFTGMNLPVRASRPIFFEFFIWKLLALFRASVSYTDCLHKK